MPKQRIADFRGGIGEKISSHMIGQTQGQSAQDVDLSSVRLQGRKKLEDCWRVEDSSASILPMIPTIQTPLTLNTLVTLSLGTSTFM